MTFLHFRSIDLIQDTTALAFKQDITIICTKNETTGSTTVKDSINGGCRTMNTFGSIIIQRISCFLQSHSPVNLHTYLENNHSRIMTSTQYIFIPMSFQYPEPTPLPPSYPPNSLNSNPLTNTPCPNTPILTIIHNKILFRMKEQHETLLSCPMSVFISHALGPLILHTSTCLSSAAEAIIFKVG